MRRRADFYAPGIMSRIDRRRVLSGFAFSLGSVCIAPGLHAQEVVVFELSRKTVRRVDLGAEEPEQKLTLVTVWLTEAGTAMLKRLTTDNIGNGLVIALPDGRQFGPNRIEKPSTGAKLGMVLPSDAALDLANAVNEV